MRSALFVAKLLKMIGAWDSKPLPSPKEVWKMTPEDEWPFIQRYNAIRARYKNPANQPRMTDIIYLSDQLDIIVEDNTDLRDLYRAEVAENQRLREMLQRHPREGQQSDK